MALGNLASRVLVAIVAVPLLLLAIYQDSPHVVWALVFAASLVAMYEFFAMSLADQRDRLASTAVGAVAVALFYWLPQEFKPHLFGFLVAFVPMSLYFLFRFGDIKSVADRWAASVVGIVYAGLLFGFLAFIKRDFGSYGGHLIVLLLCTAWLSDTGGYFAGKFLGKRKLYPAVSPNKTWAGSIGGVAAVVAGAVVIKLLLMPELSWVDVMMLAIPGSILGQLGDLAESLIKRSRGVKDSGALLPGHGGILDRVDAVLFIAPYFYLYLSVRLAW